MTNMAARILTNKKKSTLCKHVPCSTLTHSTNEDLLNIKRQGDPEVSYPLSYVRYHLNTEPMCNKSHLNETRFGPKKKVVPNISQLKKSRHFLMHWMSVKLPDNFQMREHSWPCLFHIKTLTLFATLCTH